MKYTPVTGAILIALSATAYADKTTTFQLDRVTVAATRTEQKREDVPNTVSVITEETIENDISSNIRDMIRYEPGVEVGSGTGDAQRFGAKGFNIRGMDENRVKITVDGINQANSFTPAGNPFQRSGRNHVDIDSVKRVEIVKGPASTLYGSDALGGIVAFSTKDPADYLGSGNSFGGSFKTRYGSSDKSVSETLTLANRTGNLESLLLYTRRDSDELENHDDSDNDRDSQDFESDNILVKLQYQLNPEHRIGLTHEDHQAENRTDMPAKLDSPSYSDFYYGDDETERQRTSFFHNWQGDNALFDTLNWQVDWQESEMDQETHTMFGSSSPIYRIKDYAHEEELWRLSAQFDKTLGTHHLTYGFEYNDTELTNQQNTLYPTDPSRDVLDRAVPVVEGTSYGLYLQDQIRLMDGRLLVTPGVRYDNFEAKPEIDSAYMPPSTIAAAFADHDSDKVTFRLGAVFKITDITSAFAQYSQGVKSPDLIDLYYASERNYGPGFHYLTLPNPDLDSEESDSYELGLRMNGGLGNFEFVAFYNDYKDFIESTTVDSTFNSTSFDRVTQSRNIDSATIWGLEARAALWLDDAIGAPTGTSLQVAIAFADGENDTDDRPLETVAPLKAVFGLNYQAPNENWGATLNWTLVGNKDNDELADEDDFATPGYGILDLTGHYNVTSNLALRAGVYNITGKEHWVYEDVRGLASSDTDLDLYTQPGRNIAASLIYSF
ncbi:TonB-dependent hemoglobin/transferrin/lactoferrin family receptor [Porticoccus sp.]